MNLAKTIEELPDEVTVIFLCPTCVGHTTVFDGDFEELPCPECKGVQMPDVQADDLKRLVATLRKCETALATLPEDQWHGELLSEIREVLYGN